MRTSDRYHEFVHWFAPETPDCPEIAASLLRWVKAQAEHVRTLCPPKRLRCFALVTSGRHRPHMISVEFAAPDDTCYSITIQCSGLHDVRGGIPQTASLAAGIKLLTLLTDELKVAVTLQT